MYNLIKYSDNYSDTSGRWQLKRDEIPVNNTDLRVNNGVFNSESFKYEAALVGKTANAFNNTNSSAKIIVPLKYLSNFSRSVEIPLINYKIHLELNWIEGCINWIEGCILSSDGNSVKFKIPDAKLHAPIVTLSTKDNVNLTKQLRDGFKISEQK